LEKFGLARGPKLVAYKRPGMIQQATASNQVSIPDNPDRSFRRSVTDDVKSKKPNPPQSTHNPQTLTPKNKHTQPKNFSPIPGVNPPFFAPQRALVLQGISATSNSFGDFVGFQERFGFDRSLQVRVTKSTRSET
jgi:hypothetical protein